MMQSRNNEKETENAEKKENPLIGIPDIAETRDSNAKLLLIGVVIIGMAVCWYWRSHDHGNLSQSENESFQVQTAPDLNLHNDSVSVKHIPLNTSTPAQASQATTRIADAHKALMARLHAPLLTVSNYNQATEKSASDLQKTDKMTDPNTQFLNQVSHTGFETHDAIRLKHPDTLLAQDTLIHAVLETAIHSDLPGYLRAIVSEPVYAEDGSQVLIPAGSRLIGQYKSGMLNGQSRIFAVWTRVIEPNGISLQLGSPSVGNLGEAGVGADSIDRHFWQMFGTATLLSILGAGASNIGVNNVSST